MTTQTNIVKFREIPTPNEPFCPLCQSSDLRDEDPFVDHNGPRNQLNTNVGHVFHKNCLKIVILYKGDFECPQCQFPAHTKDLFSEREIEDINKKFSEKGKNHTLKIIRNRIPWIIINNFLSHVLIFDLFVEDYQNLGAFVSIIVAGTLEKIESKRTLDRLSELNTSISVCHSSRLAYTAFAASVFTCYLLKISDIKIKLSTHIINCLAMRYILPFYLDRMMPMFDVSALLEGKV